MRRMFTHRTTYYNYCSPAELNFAGLSRIHCPNNPRFSGLLVYPSLASFYHYILGNRHSFIQAISKKMSGCWCFTHQATVMAKMTKISNARIITDVAGFMRQGTTLRVALA